jgi:plastocyanin
LTAFLYRFHLRTTNIKEKYTMRIFHKKMIGICSLLAFTAIASISLLASCGGSGGGAQAITHSISGVVTSGNTGQPGVTMTLSGDGSATTTTDASGNYTFAGLTNGDYLVTPSKTGLTLIPTNRLQTVSDANISGVNFNDAGVSTYSISGTVTQGGTALPGVTMTLAGAGSATVTTDASGNYTFGGLVNGAYTVTPGKTGYTFTPTGSPLTISSANIPNSNFAATLPQTARIVTCPATGSGVTLVNIQDFSFSPATVSVNVNGIIKWTNHGPAVHTVTSGTSPTADGVFNSGNVAAVITAPVCVQFYVPGSYPYFSATDLTATPPMTGVVLVH